MKHTSAEITGADAVVGSLLASGVEVCFANPGTSEMALMAALDKKPGLRCILGLFEGVVTGAADGYARMADKPAATLLHCGPGLANGLANLHNARRARTPIVNIVGDHATHHLPMDPALASDIEGIARTQSDWVRCSRFAETVGSDTARAVEAANASPGGISTLIVPADVAWTDGAALHTARERLPPAVPSDATINRVVDKLQSRDPTVFLLAGEAMRSEGLRAAERVSAATGASLLGQMLNGRISRGGDLPAVAPIPYPIDAAIAALAPFKNVILVGADMPVAFFAYPGRPSSLIPEDSDVTVLAAEQEDAVEALKAVAMAFPKAKRKAGSGTTEKPSVAKGDLTADGIARSVGALLPDQAIVADEGITSGRNLFSATVGAGEHDWLQLTGGAIGIGIPLSTGAAIACPDRRTVCLQADGSGMYTLQGLWTQARENLNVTTVIYANRSYAILRQELANLGVESPGRNATDMMDLSRPDLDWVQMSRGMGVEACHVSTMEEFNDAFNASLTQPGPFLIEAALC